MPGEVKDPTQGVNICVTCSGFTNSREGQLKKTNANNGQQVDRWPLMEEEEEEEEYKMSTLFIMY